MYDRRDYWYFFDGIKPTTAQTCKVEPKKLRTIYSDNFNYPIDKGAIEALVPNSNAYSHLCRTNVKSYAIAGSYRPNATESHSSQESYYKIIVDPDHFNLDKDAFDDAYFNYATFSKMARFDSVTFSGKASLIMLLSLVKQISPALILKV